jgi:hypothetical protein
MPRLLRCFSQEKSGIDPKAEFAIDRAVRYRFFGLVGFAAFMGSGCLSVQGASSAAIPLVRAHAQTDLDCPQAEIKIEQELGGKYKAVGCGQKAVYTAACDGLSCVVRGENERAIPWRARPDPTPTP